MRERVRGTQERLEADAAGVLVPRVPNGQHFSDRIHQSQVLDEESSLVNSLIVEEGGEPIASVESASKDDTAGDFAAESHFGKKCIDCRAGNSFELGNIERPTGKGESDTGKVDVAIAHKGLVLAHMAMSHAFRELIAFGSALDALLRIASGRAGPHSKRAVGFGGVLLEDRTRIGFVAVGQGDGGIWHGSRAEEDGSAVLMKVPGDDIIKTLGKVECPARRPEEAFPDLGFGVHALGYVRRREVVVEHGSQAEVKNECDIVNEAIASPFV
jgi:hypothetical protein